MQVLQQPHAPLGAIRTNDDDDDASPPSWSNFLDMLVFVG